jgi:uncharacterized protein (TIGR03083 family)
VPTTLDALHRSAARLRALGQSLSDEDVARPAYPSEWTIAGVFSHLGSGATILRHLVDDVVFEREGVEGRHQRVWDEWNAKAPNHQVEHSLVADAELLARFESLDPAERAGFALTMGPIAFDYDGLVASRLNELVLHTWDIQVALDPAATLPADAAALVADNLSMVVTWTGRPTEEAREITVGLSDTGRAVTVTLGPDRVSLADAGARSVDLSLPTEAFVRLVYGRLDPAHSPPGVEGESLDLLRRAFPGV